MCAQNGWLPLKPVVVSIKTYSNGDDLGVAAYFRTPPPKSTPQKASTTWNFRQILHRFPGRDLAKFNQLLIKPIELPISPYKVGPQFVS